MTKSIRTQSRSAKMVAAINATSPAPSAFDFAKGSIAHVRFEMKNIEERARTRLDKFAKDFSTNPAHAFEWANNAIEAAGELNAAMCVLVWLDNLKVVEVAVNDGEKSMPEFLSYTIKEFMTQAMREVEYPAKSSSMAHVEMQRQKARGFLMVATRLTAISEGKW